MKYTLLFVICLLISLFAADLSVSAQTTEFTYQGRLLNASAPATGNYDFEFALYDAVSGGAQIGVTLTRSSVAVTNGDFSVKLDFGSSFPGANRFLEIRVRQSGGGAFTPLAPRQQVNSAPYSVKSLNSATADSVAVAGVPAGSGNYIQNTTTPQSSSNFNITGTGTSNLFNAATQYNLGGDRLLSAPGNLNFFAGIGAGLSTTTGGENAFFGYQTGQFNTTGIRNSFFGIQAGYSNTTGTYNSFYGFQAGLLNSTARYNSFFGSKAGYSITTGEENNFFGYSAGLYNNTGAQNSFFGSAAGYYNTAGHLNAFFGAYAGTFSTTGSWNAFFGGLAGQFNTTGESNSFFGQQAGDQNTTGGGNTIIGAFADVGADNLTNTSAIGARAYVTQNNSLVLGSINGVNGATADTFVGIGTTAPQKILHVKGENVRVEGNTTSTLPRFSLYFTGGMTDAGKWQNYAANGALRFSALNDAETAETIWLNVTRSGASVSQVQFLSAPVAIGTLGAAGATSLCRNASNEIATCSSSLRYKTNFAPYLSGLSVVNRLRPISFDWKAGGARDLGFGAEDVEKIDPLLVTYNDRGEVEGVKYDRIGVVLVNAVKEQQAQIEELEKQNQEQQKQIDGQNKVIKQQQEKSDAQQAEINALKTLVCSQNPAAELCKPKEK